MLHRDPAPLLLPPSGWFRRPIGGLDQFVVCCCDLEMTVSGIDAEFVVPAMRGAIRNADLE